MRVPHFPALAIAAGLATTALCRPAAPLKLPPEAPGRPLWIERAKSADSVYEYVVGHAVGREAGAGLRQAAVEDAATRLTDDLLIRAGVAAAEAPALRARVALPGLEPVPDAIHYEATKDGTACWIMVSFPLTEREKILATLAALQRERRAEQEAREALDARLNDAYRRARAAALAGDAAGALALLREPLAGYGRMTRPAFQLEEAQVLAGDLNRDRNEPLAARAIYETVRGTSTSQPWRAEAEARLAGLPRPPRFWPLRVRLGDGPIALLAAVRTDQGPVAAFDALETVLARDLDECRIPRAPIGPLPPAQLEALFTGRQLEEVCRAAEARGARALIAVISRVDSSLRGKTQDVMGVAMPLPDTSIEAHVVDVKTRTAVHTATFREITGSSGPAKSAERIATILIGKYLVPRCPSLDGQPAAAP
ncbi:MAG: hypothetical protein FJ221_10000 [Lentisphaerae bacterium]|nr:hypothetical protein [Lentisphaerota bacterium]